MCWFSVDGSLRRHMSDSAAGGVGVKSNWKTTNYKMTSQQKSADSASSVSRSQSREVLLDSSSASSLSVFADHSETSTRLHEIMVTEAQKSGECSPSRGSVDEALKSEAAFIHYLTSIPSSKESPTDHRSTDHCVPTRNRSPAAVSKVGLDHLDNLCKLMEQLGELRDANGKLQKRVQYLEDLKTLHEMHKEICEGGEYSSEDALSSKPPQNNFPLQKSATETHCFPSAPNEGQEQEVSSRSPSRYLGRRSRRGQEEEARRRCRSKSVGHEDMGDPKSRRLFPKWSRVKEAFGWESERKGSMKKEDTSFASRRRSDESRQMYRHIGNSSWYQDCPSVLSSTEDIDECHEDEKQKPLTLDRDPYNNSQEYAKYYKEDLAKRGKSPWGRVKTIIERHRDSLKRRSLRRDQSATDLDKNLGDAIDFKAYDEFLDGGQAKMAALPSPTKQKTQKPGPLVIDPEEPKTPPGSSPNLQRKSRWNRVTKVLKGKKEDSMSLSSPNTPNEKQEGNFTFDVIEEMSQGSQSELSRVGSVNQLSMPSTDIMLQLQRNLSEDFHRKILEWDRMRAASGNASSTPSQWDPKSRKKSERDDKTGKPKIKDLTWLEKELQKIEKEKQRLSKEKQKYEERAHRLEKLKETVLSANSSNKREVLVRTSAGEFRFEGISDAFTKKLYEWETKRGLGPELSTIALLDSSRAPACLGAKMGPLQRVLSRSESSVVDVGQPSHNSSNSLPSVKLPDEVNQPSRANSEPDLATLAAFTNGTGISVVRPLAEAKGADLPSSAVEVRKESEGEEDDFDKPPRKGSGTYYGLLEENVILLEQLKEKEEICRRLEKDLGVLDEKMDDMSNRHLQETQRYREKLWELHQAGPRDAVCCRRTMEQLRKRIETLEKWTKKLRSDRDTVEINFRHHSREQETMTLDLLGKMRELHAVGSSAVAESDTREIPRMDINTIERLQDLSALLTKQTLDVEERMSEKSRQISHLKWELLHRDLSNVKQEAEQHSHNSAHRKRTGYAHWRSRSSEEPPVSAPASQKMLHPSNFEMAATEMYEGPSTPDELKATYLANTVQQLNKELQKLTSAHSGTSLSKYLDDGSSYSSSVGALKLSEVSRIPKKLQVSSKTNPKRITVRRSSADNLSLVSTDDNRVKNNATSSTDDSSDEYYSRVCYNSGHKLSNYQNIDTERLLMSYGEHPPRTSNQRKKKFQKSSKLNSALLRKRSNTFHTNRDLQKPSISENVPQKCQSFRVARENYLEDSPGDKIAYSRRKIQNSHFNIRSQDIANYQTKMDHKFQEAALLRKSMGKVGVLENYSVNWLREVASDSKLPILMQAQISSGVEQSTDNCTKCPIRSMSDKTKNESATEKREHILKKRTKKRLKSPDPSFMKTSPTSSKLNSNIENVESSDISNINDLQRINSTTQKRSSLSRKDSTENKCTVEQKYSQTSVAKEIPTITIQLSKRKHRKSSCVVTEISPSEEQSFTIVIPKKRSLSSECESSISESSPREPSMLINSDQKSDSPDSACWTTTTNRSSTAPQLNISNLTESNDNASIQLMRLVSLNNFETPFVKNGYTSSKNSPQDEQLAKKRKAEDNVNENQESPSGNMNDMILKIERQISEINHQSTTKTSEVELEVKNRPPVSHYVKSPSAPQLDWRKVCAKKVSKSGAPNVRTLIERYNQKVIESQSPKSPLSSNVSSPVIPRKISTPVGSCTSTEYVPCFCSTPNTPTVSPTQHPLLLCSNFQNTPPSSPNSVARSLALSRAKEHFIVTQSSTPTSPVMPRIPLCHAHSSDSGRTTNRLLSDGGRKTSHDLQKIILNPRRSDEDRTSNSSMDSMNIVMMRAGENCRESRCFQKRTTDVATSCDQNSLKTSKSLSGSSLFKSVLGHSSLLRLKRSKRKKDMSAVTELCRQSLMLTTDDVASIPASVSHKSCPNSPELKTKSPASKPSWLQRNIFRQK